MDALSVVGLGKLGACTAACLAARGYRVLGVDTNMEVVQAFNAGVPPMHEPRLGEMMQVAGGRLQATTDYGRAIRETDTTFLVVPTPTDESGEFSDRYLREVLTPLARNLRASSKPYHLFVITSTVSPGTIDGRLVPLIAAASGRTLNEGFGVCYNPEFIALGSVISDFLRPDLVLIGESDQAAGARVANVYHVVCENAPAVKRMSIVEAEIVKISVNSFVTVKISFANTLAQICEAIPGANVDLITQALGADRRVSPYALRGGPPFGGPCFPRDNRAFAAFARRYGVDAALAVASDDINVLQVHRIVDLVLRYLDRGAGGLVAVLGLAYKPNTPVVEESIGMYIAEALVQRGAVVSVYDPLACDDARRLLGDRVKYVASARDCVHGAAVWVVTTQLEEFRELEAADISRDLTTVIDCWRFLDPTRLGPRVRYVALGAARPGAV